MYGLKLTMMLLDHTGNLSARLQTTNLYAAEETARLVADTIYRMRNEQDTISFYKMVKINANQVSVEEPSFPGKRKVSNRVNFLQGYKESGSHHHKNSNDFFRV